MAPLVLFAGAIRAGASPAVPAGAVHAGARAVAATALAADAAGPADLAPVLLAAIDRGAPLYNEGDAAGCAEVYAAAVRAVLAMASPPAWAREALNEGLRMAAGERDPRERAWILRRAIDRVLRGPPVGDPVAGLDVPEDFVPAAEADLPAGFPGPAPAGRLVLKRYPPYRAARAEGGRGAFWTLFTHIKRNDVAMTAPVEMTLEGGDGAAVRDMAFLYGRPDLGRAGRDGPVEVLDLPGATVLSVGLNGPVTEERAAAARRAIEARLASDPSLEAAGEYRLLGYNSPMIPEARRFYEIQRPVRPATTPATR